MKKFISVYLAFGAILCAHPHVFIDANVEISQEKITLVWRYDEMTSNLMILDYDTNKNKKFEKSEIASIYKDHFSTLREYNWFTKTITNNKENPLLQTSDFGAFIDQEQVVYRFSFPKPAAKDFELRLYDPQIYVAIEVMDDSLKCGDKMSCQLEEFDEYGYGYKVNVHE